ncbi:NUDIX hydrolase [Pseudooceanicola algae]|uniref:Uncharacterized protein n=1 Tax=Pseudooceanicola algae TaxID=1537215 RepID=A0A418SCA2_9RHOB|nr:NUDIX hydrolase [Pseudooceanicola algae]QPM90011.1 hypothetical protein PSAL_012420 [Pseudooceanicola algae]
MLPKILPVPAVLAVVPRLGPDDLPEILLVRRANPPDAGLWGFPGGHLDPGEPLATAALRELCEETGVSASAGPVLDALDALDRDEAGALRCHFVLIAVLCHWQSGTPEAADDALQAAWVPLSQLREGTLPASAGVLALSETACARLIEKG